MEYQVELLKTTVKKLNIAVGVKDAVTFQLEGETTATVFEPTDDNDPTILVQASSTMRTANSDQLSIAMETEFIFQFDPIPENRTAAASQYCPGLINKKLDELAVTFVHNMGHEFEIEK